MGWKDLLQKEETITLPWVGGKYLQSLNRTWQIEGPLPREHSWVEFKVGARKATVIRSVGIDYDVVMAALDHFVHGYLVGDRIVLDNIRVAPEPQQLVSYSERVHICEEGTERFTRISAGRVYSDGPLIFRCTEMPLGPEFEVQNAFLNKVDSVINIKGVSPALDAAFRMESWYRAEAERRRAEAERRRREEEERRLQEERRAQLVAQLGDGAGRRAMAQVDFTEAARAALAIGGAEYLDHRRSYNRGEMVVTFRVGQRRYECTCDAHTLQIIEAGICLTDHDTGERGDTFFTLESLPGVIREAERRHALHVFRHIDDENPDWDE